MVNDESKFKKTVSFGYSRIRTYNRAMGDNPSVSSGPPISIGWNPISEAILSIDEYEHRRKNRDKSFMRISRLERELILKKHCGVTAKEMAECVRNINRIKTQRRNTVLRMEDWSRMTKRPMGAFLVVSGTKTAVLPHERIKGQPTQETEASTVNVPEWSKGTHRSLESINSEEETIPMDIGQGRGTNHSGTESSTNDSETKPTMCGSLLEKLGFKSDYFSNDTEERCQNDQTMSAYPQKKSQVPPVTGIIVRTFSDDSTVSSEESATCISFFNFFENFVQLGSASPHELDVTRRPEFIL